MDIGINNNKNNKGGQSSIINEATLKLFIRNILNEKKDTQYNDSIINQNQPLKTSFNSQPYCYKKKKIIYHRQSQPSNFLSFDINLLNPSKYQISKCTSIGIKPSLNSRLQICSNYQYQYLSHKNQNNSVTLKKRKLSFPTQIIRKNNKYKDVIINCSAEHNKSSSRFYKGDEGKIHLPQKCFNINHTTKNNYYGIKKKTNYILNSQNNTKFKKISISVIKSKTKSLHSSRTSKPFNIN